MDEYWQNVIRRIDERVAVPQECRYLKVAWATDPGSELGPTAKEMRLYDPGMYWIHPRQPGFTLRDLRDDLENIMSEQMDWSDGVYLFDLETRTSRYHGNAFISRPELVAEWGD